MNSEHTPRLQTGHVGLNVSDLARAKAFYQDLFGFGLIAESQQPSRRFALLGDNGQIVLTLWEQSIGRFAAAQPGLHHLSFQVPSLEDVRSIEQKLRARNVRFLYDGVVPHAEGADSGGIFFEDPDGIRLEIFTRAGLAGKAAPTPDGPTCGFF